MRRYVVAANWKMHFNVNEAETTARQMVDNLGEVNSEIVVCPSFVFLDRLCGIFNGTNIRLGAQNMHSEEEGAFTGEVSPVMLKSVGCEYVILGHSERRYMFGENDVEIRRKVVSAIKHGLKPILCVGETLAQRKEGRAKSVVERQIIATLDGVDLDKVVLAYEPVWAIGTGIAADTATVSEMHEFIRGIVEDIPILYGGSVKDENALELAKIEDVDGFLVGTASLDAEHFKRIVTKFEETKEVG